MAAESYGTAPQAAAQPDRYAGMAPGSEDFDGGAHHLFSKGDRDIALSDPRAKREAFIDGVNATQRMHDTGEAVPAPDYLKEPHPGEHGRAKPGGAVERGMAGLVKYGGAVGPESGQGFGATNAFQKAQVGAQILAGKQPVDINNIALGREKVAPRPHMAQQPGAPVAHAPAPSGDFDAQVRDQFGAPPQGSPAPPAPQADVPGYFGQFAQGTRTMISDPRSKTATHDSPMADANRSMAPSSYQYRPEFTPPEQQPGETNVGPMANKMEANPVAKTAIVKDPQTGLLAIDKTKALKLTMGGLSSLQRQVDQLQSRMKGARP